MATKSIQPRFNSSDESSVFGAYLRIVQFATESIADYLPDTRRRDKDLLAFYRSENLLAGVVSSSVSRDKNRSWTLTGAARQVSTYANKLHNVHDGRGWREFVSLNSTSWYTSDLGYASEIGFRTKNGVPETMWHMDSTNLKLTGNKNEPLIYYPASGKNFLKPGEFIHGNSMPSTEEKMNGAGFCALERCLKWTRLMLGVFRHDLEKLGVAPPKGIMLSKGITEKEFNESVDRANVANKDRGSEVYKGVLTIFTNNPDASMELIGLSNLPENFSLKQFVEVVMQGYALAFGYPVGEFWAIETGSFGRAGELKEQQKQATAKGELDFALSFQEQLQMHFLPASVNFQFDQRNDRGDLVEIERDKTYSEMVTDLYTKTASNVSVDEEGNEVITEEALIDKVEGRSLLANEGVIPSDWTLEKENTVATDLQEMRERTLYMPEVLRTAYSNPNEPIVIYEYSPESVYTKIPVATKYENSEMLNRVMREYYYPVGRVRVVWENGDEMIKQRFF